MIHSVRLAFALGLVSLQVACASFPAGKLERREVAGSSSGKSISVIFTGSVEMNGQAHDANPTMLEVWQTQTLKAYQDSDAFATVRSGLYESDLRADVELLNTGEPNVGLAFLSGLTLTLIPAKASDHMRVTTRFSDLEGNLLAEIVKEETINTWIQLFLVFLTPSNFPNGVVEQVVRDLSTATIAEAVEQGVFDGSGGSLSGGGCAAVLAGKPCGNS
ncbi:MAG: hypothetical protein ACQGVC_07855 [Myxococcota bacterium]